MRIPNIDTCVNNLRRIVFSGRFRYRLWIRIEFVGRQFYERGPSTFCVAVSNRYNTFGGIGWSNVFRTHFRFFLIYIYKYIYIYIYVIYIYKYINALGFFSREKKSLSEQGLCGLQSCKISDV